MANMIKINGRFVVPTEKILEQLRSWAKPAELSVNQIVGESPFEEEVKNETEETKTTSETVETQVPNVLETLHLEFSNKFGKEVPVNKKNDANRITEKLKEETK